MSLPTMDCFRSTIHALGEDGQEFNHAELYTVFGVERDEVDARRTLRGRCVNLVGQGELRRVGPGRYVVVPNAAPRRKGELFDRMWRGVISAGNGWTLADLSVVSGVSATHARRYISWLLEEGYVARRGLDGNAFVYRTTVKAKERRVTAYPPVRPSGGYAKERSAMANMGRLFACANLYQPAVRAKIVESCRIILSCFETEEVNDAG